jgi:hypothetical protein
MEDPIEGRGGQRDWGGDTGALGGYGSAGLFSRRRQMERTTGGSFLNLAESPRAGATGGYVRMPGVGPAPVIRDVEFGKSMAPSGPTAMASGVAPNFYGPGPREQVPTGRTARSMTTLAGLIPLLKRDKQEPEAEPEKTPDMPPDTPTTSVGPEKPKGRPEEPKGGEPYQPTLWEDYRDDPTNDAPQGQMSLFDVAVPNVVQKTRTDLEAKYGAPGSQRKGPMPQGMEFLTRGMEAAEASKNPFENLDPAVIEAAKNMEYPNRGTQSVTRPVPPPANRPPNSRNVKRGTK